MAILEISKNYVNKYYNGDKQKAIQARDGIIFDAEKIARTFKNGVKGFEEYRKNNTQFCYYVNIN